MLVSHKHSTVYDTYGERHHVYSNKQLSTVSKIPIYLLHPISPIDNNRMDSFDFFIRYIYEYSRLIVVGP